VKTFALAVALAGLVACSASDDHPDRPPSTVAFEGSDTLLYVAVADDPDEQRRGLMGVDSLPADEGMAFVWDEPVASTFWMKDTLIPLSIAFVDEDGRVIGVRDMQPCEEDPCPSYGVDEPYVLAVEANSRWFQEHGVEAGDRAELTVMAYQ
jgi:uncharacterized membrane protein (UPF0127 family)